MLNLLHNLLNTCYEAQLAQTKYAKAKYATTKYSKAKYAATNFNP